MVGTIVGLAAFCGVIVATFQAGRMRGEEDMAAFREEVAGESLLVDMKSDS